MRGPPNPDSFIRVGDRTVELKVHRCIWSGRYSENSPLAIAECATERVMRTEIDVRALRDGEFVVLHDDRFDRVTDATGLVRDATAVEATRRDSRMARTRFSSRRRSSSLRQTSTHGGSSWTSRTSLPTPGRKPRR